MIVLFYGPIFMDPIQEKIENSKNATPASQSPSPYLEVTIQMVNGAKMKFAETQQSNADALLKKIKPNKIFTERTLPILQPNCLTGIPTSGISWIVFRTPAKIDWPYPANITGAELITAKGFKNSLTTDLEKIRQKMLSNQSGQSFDAYWLAQMADGTDFYFRIHSLTLSRMEKLQVPKTFAELSAFHGVGATGGAVVLNMANVNVWTVFPGPQEYAPNTWQLKKI